MSTIESILEKLTISRRIEHQGASVLASVHWGDSGVGTLSEPSVMSREILEAGEAFLARQGCERVWGPMEGSHGGTQAAPMRDRGNLYHPS